MSAIPLDQLLTFSVFAMLVVTALVISFAQRIFRAVIFSGVFSLLSALLFIVMDAVDVAFTEAAVGAGISTVLMLSTIVLSKEVVSKPRHSVVFPLLVSFGTGAVLFYGTLDMPAFGAFDAPAQSHVYPEYLARTPVDIDVPNVVTAILASYRGFDTLGEVAVVFTAGIGSLLLLSGLKRRRKDKDET